MRAQTTWELHYAVPRTPTSLYQLLSILNNIVRRHTSLRVDFIEDVDKISVMIGDISVFQRIVADLVGYEILSISVHFDSDEVKGDLRLDDDEEENSTVEVAQHREAEVDSSTWNTQQLTLFSMNSAR